MSLYQEIYDTLHHTNWKVAREVHEEVAQRRNVDPATLSLHRFYPLLHSLVEEDLAEERERTLTSEQLAIRGNRPAIEYRLTPAGLKKRIAPSSPKGIEGIILPENAQLLRSNTFYMKFF